MILKENVLRFIYTIAITLAGCSGSTGYVEYQPLGLPISITVDTNGDISVNGSASVVTLIGEFEFGVAVPVQANSNEVILIIRNRNAELSDKVFRITAGRDITITTNGTTVIQVNSEGMVLIDITDGSVQSIQIDSGRPIVTGPDGRPLCGEIPSLFSEGDIAVVDFNADGALRILTDYRGGAMETIVQAYNDSRLELLEGPVCYNDTWYWKVWFERPNVIGWAAEGIPSDRYMCPTYQSECA